MVSVCRPSCTGWLPLGAGPDRVLLLPPLSRPYPAESRSAAGPAGWRTAWLIHSQLGRQLAAAAALTTAEASDAAGERLPAPRSLCATGGNLENSTPLNEPAVDAAAAVVGRIPLPCGRPRPPAAAAGGRPPDRILRTVYAARTRPA